MSSLILESLEIHNFRGFRHFKMEPLARINLIVGKNNAGKTSLLEALQLYARRGSPFLALQLLQERDELPPSIAQSRQNPEEIGESILGIKHLFYNRPDITDEHDAIQIGPVGSKSDTLSLSIGGWSSDFTDFEIDRILELSSLTLITQFGSDSRNHPLHRYVNRKVTVKVKKAPYIFISESGFENPYLAELWDEVTLTPLEKDVINALRIVEPNVERLNFVNHPNTRDRIPKVKIAGQNEPVPLRSMGQGIKRVLGIILAVANTKDKMLLIDEIDSGLHYSVLSDVWNLIFEVAARLNVQLFATTHSWDCIEAFQVAIAQHEEVDGVLFSLRNKKGKPGEVVAIRSDKQDLDAIVSYPTIEVR